MSNEERSAERLTVLKINETSNIRYESNGDFKTSILYNSYKNAFQITKEIIGKNEELWKSGNKTTGTIMRNHEQIYNIISFTGGRGTGKTSAMLSYMEFLKDYYKKLKRSELDEEWVFSGSEFNKDGYMFTGIEYIDASVLNNKKEDILGSVLSKMLKKWMDEDKRSYGESGIVKTGDYDYKKRQIRLKFSNVYDCLKDLRSEKDILDKDSDMYMETLEKLSLTLNVKQSFQQLVDDFLDIMEYPVVEGRLSKKNHFLVISIDDLDLNINNGFMMLEQIRMYLMVPNVIVLLSANYEQLEQICYNHYMTEFFHIKDEPEIREYVHALTREYLEKVIPPQRCINFMSGKKWTFFDRQDLIIKKGNRKVDGTLKIIIKKELSDYFNINFGEKCLYYLTPDTLRGINSWINQISSLCNLKNLKAEAIDEEIDWEQYLESYNKNLQWLWDEEYPRLCNKHLNYREKKVFTTLDLSNPVEQFEQIKEILYEVSTKKDKIQVCSTLPEMLALVEHGNQQEQAITALSMIYYTGKVTSLINKLFIQEKIDNREYINELITYFGNGRGGIWGEWENKIIGSLSREIVGKELVFSDIGYIPCSEEDKCFSIQLEFTAIDKDNSKIIEDVIEPLKAYQYVLLFYRLVNVDLERPVWTVGKSGNKIEIDLCQKYNGVFSFSNFVISMLDTNRLFEKFLDDFQTGLKKYGKNKGYEDILKKISIKEEIEKFGTEPLLPIGDMEFLVHTGRMIYEQVGSGKVKSYTDSEIINKLKDYAQVLIKSLKQYDSQHGTNKMEYFSEFPLINKIVNGNKYFKEKFIYCVKALTNPVLQPFQNTNK